MLKDMNEIRRERAKGAMEAHAHAMYPKAKPAIDWDMAPEDVYWEECFIDAVTDIWHLAEYVGLNMEVVVRYARDNYKREVQDEIQS